MYTWNRRPNFDLIAHRVAAAGGIAEIELHELLHAYRAQRAGCNVREGISTELQRRGIRHLPSRMPKDQNHTLVLYDTTTRPGQCLDGALEFARLTADQLTMEEAA